MIVNWGYFFDTAREVLRTFLVLALEFLIAYLIGYCIAWFIHHMREVRRLTRLLNANKRAFFKAMNAPFFDTGIAMNAAEYRDWHDQQPHVWLIIRPKKEITDSEHQHQEETSPDEEQAK